MRAEVIQKLKDVNREFYQSFATSFSQTRGRIQPGVRRILDGLQQNGNWLDVGCGNGNFASALAEGERKGNYLGVDASPALIQKATEQFSNPDQIVDMEIRFQVVDVNEPEWQKKLPAIKWSHVFLFAVLHHIPGAAARIKLCQEINRLVSEACKVYLSVWQVRNSPRMLKKIQPWELIQLRDDDVESGDVLMDWRRSASGEKGQTGLRYVHVFDALDLTDLAEKGGFQVMDQFYSDGKEGNLGLYQTWRKN